MGYIKNPRSFYYQRSDEDKSNMYFVMKITLIECKPYDFEAKEGGRITGYMYSGFLSSGAAIRFSSKADYPVHEDVTSFDPNNFKDIPLKVKIWDGKAKYSDTSAPTESQGRATN